MNPDVVNPITTERFPLTNNNNCLVLDRVRSVSVCGSYGSERVKCSDCGTICNATGVKSVLLKVIPQKLKFPMNFCETFLECSLPSSVFEKNNKKDRSPFLLKRYDGPILPYLCLYSC